MKVKWSILLFFALLFATNRYLSVQSNHAEISVIGPDSFNYLVIAAKSPLLPTIEDKIPFHHGQRFLLPYLIGAVSKALNLPLHSVFFTTCIILIFLTTLFFNRIIMHLKLGQSVQVLLNALLILNPYGFRYFLSIPYLINDLCFISCITIIIYLLFEKKYLAVLPVLFVAGMVRQTALPFMFFTLVWVFLFDRKKISFIFWFALTAICSNVVGSYIASLFSTQGATIEAVTAIFYWFKSSFNFVQLLEFLLRSVLPLLLTLLLLVSAKPRQNKNIVKILLLAVFLICIQPFLGGPQITGQNATRLNVLGLVPALVALAVGVKDYVLKFNGRHMLVYFVVFASSLHHVFSTLGQKLIKTPTAFAAIHVLLVLVAAWLVNSLTKSKHSQ